MVRATLRVGRSRLACALVVLSGMVLLQGCRLEDGALDGSERARVVAPATDETDAGGAGGPDASRHADAGPEKPPHLPLLKAGLHPDASDALRALGITADQITQTIGDEVASAGTHLEDGTVDGRAYGAATDIGVRGLSDADIKDFLDGMTQYGFAGWFRNPGEDGWPSNDVRHFHIIYTGAPMKLLLRNQCRDWFDRKNGLRSHALYGFFTWTLAQRVAVEALYVKHNPLVE